MAPCIYLVHRRPDLYPQPASFRPERFLGSEAETYSWIPFGGGMRRCLGASFATLEIKVALQTILPAADLLPATPEPEAPRLRLVTLVPARGAEVVLERRRPARRRGAPEAAAA